MDLVHGATPAGPPRTHQPAAAMWPPRGRGPGQPAGCCIFVEAPCSSSKSTRGPSADSKSRFWFILFQK